MKYFHRVANGGRNRKFIKSLMFEEGVTLGNIKNISKEIVHFFKKRYSKPSGKFWRIEGLDWFPILQKSVVWLDRPLLEEEVCFAIF